MLWPEVRKSQPKKKTNAAKAPHPVIQAKLAHLAMRAPAFLNKERSSTEFKLPQSDQEIIVIDDDEREDCAALSKPPKSSRKPRDQLATVHDQSGS